MKPLRRLTPHLIRAASFCGGAAIIHHEVWTAETAEPLLFFGGLWLAGAPIAEFLDKLRRFATLPAEVETEPPIEVEEPPPKRRHTDRRRS